MVSSPQSQRQRHSFLPCAVLPARDRTISLPNRYMHSPVELVSLKDLEQIPQLLAAFAQSVKKGEQFKVQI